jgi:transposase
VSFRQFFPHSSKNCGVEPVPFHKGYYWHCHHVENFFQRIKRLRRITTHYDKLAEVFLDSILLAASLIWINSF